MLAWIVGNVDVPAAAVLCVAFVFTGVFATSWITTRRSKRAVEIEYDLAKMKETQQHGINVMQIASNEKCKMAELALKKEIEWKRIDSNMITSHTSETAS